MDHRFLTYDAILFPADGRSPHIVQLLTSSTSGSNPYNSANGGRIVHPETHMEYIAESLGPRAWAYQASLDATFSAIF